MTLNDDLVTLLRDNGRLPVSEISRRLNTPRHQVDERLHELINSGSLQFSANVHPALLGIHYYSHVLLWTNGSTQFVAERLSKMPEVPLVSVVAGEHDITLEVGTPNRDSLTSVLAKIKQIPGVRFLRSSVHTKTFESRFNVEADLAEADFPPLDDINLQLVHLLRLDGRMPYQKLSNKVGLSIGAVRARIKKLLNSGMLRITCVPRWKDATRNFVVGVGLNTTGPSAGIELLVSHLQASATVEYGALTLGHFDLIATLSSASFRELRETLDSIKDLAIVQQATSWMHLELVRESYEISDF
jgi:DNA-binding Lrp family transcriptional regulator